GQFNLLVGERSRSRARHSQYTDRIPFTQERDSKNGTVAGDIQDPGRFVLGIGLAILDVNWTPFEQDPASTGVTPGPEGEVPHRLFVPRRLAEICSNCVHVTVWAYYARCFGIAQATRRLYKRIEYGLQIESRAADDLEHVRRRRLLLQRLTQLVKQAGVLDRDDSLRSEVHIRGGRLRALAGTGAPPSHWVPDMLDRPHPRIKHELYLSADQVDEGGPCTTIRHVEYVETGHHLEELASQMGCASRPCRCHVQLAGVGF